MNEDLVEKWGGKGRTKRPQRKPDTAVILMQEARLNTRILQYFNNSKEPTLGAPWTARAAVPTSAEVLDQDEGSDASSQSSGVVILPPNKPRGPWNSTEEYLQAHYELLREDAVRPLRDAVSNLKITPQATEESFHGAYSIYEKVHVCGLTCSPRGIALRVTFSTRRAGKKILWEQSKRLVSGSLVVLSPSHDMFQTKAIVATVAARPKAGLVLNPPEVDLFFARAEEVEIDPKQPYVMVQDRSGFFEGQKHTLVALQKMMKESFPIADHFVNLQAAVPAPRYLQDQPIEDLTAVFVNSTHQKYDRINLLTSWPTQPNSDLDDSQIAALKRMLTKRLAIVQGPPGTGKTYVSIQALKILVSNMKEKDPPIVIACQTNHALDQLLRHVAGFVKDWARVGGQSKDEEIKKRTVYELNKIRDEHPPAGSQLRSVTKSMHKLQDEIKELLKCLALTGAPLDHMKLQQYGILSQDQVDSLEHGASQWVQRQFSNPNEARSPFVVWLGRSLIPVPFKAPEEDYGFDFEEAELDFEQLREAEAENPVKDDDDIEILPGTHHIIADNFTSQKAPGLTESDVVNLLAKEKDLWKIHQAARGPVYLYLQHAMKRYIRDQLRPKIKAHNEQAQLRRIGLWETHHEPVLKKQKIIGMTTTGFSKYRALVSALQPKVILIEEAAETLEAPVIAACVPSLEHLILVGDHKQLRPHCQVKALEDKPYHLNMSLFERLIENSVEYDTLRKQRRMIPEVRRLLYPIYKDIVEDHASVTLAAHRPDIPGMGGVNSFFFTHHWPEERDDNMSATNKGEADMIAGFVRHLIFNGLQQEQITILTFYNGQRKHLLKTMRSDVELHTFNIQIVTVDSYQGEENDVVILSLTRSNDFGNIGFLNVDNRVCVALSRARRGFYLFGNGQMLWQASKVWYKVIKIIAGHERKLEIPQAEPRARLGEEFPVRCSKHNNLVKIKAGEDWQKINGGCTLKCEEILDCGHICPLKCHPFGKDWVKCLEICKRILSCGHKCEAICGEECVCGTCKDKSIAKRVCTSVTRRSSFDGKETLSQHSSSSASWQSFARAEPERYAVAASQPPSYRTSPSRNDLHSLRHSPDKKYDEKAVHNLSLRLAISASGMEDDAKAHNQHGIGIVAHQPLQVTTLFEGSQEGSGFGEQAALGKREALVEVKDQEEEDLIQLY